MSLATQVIEALQNQNQQLKQQVQGLQDQLTALQQQERDGSVETPADMTVINTAAQQLGIVPEAQDNPAASNQSGGTSNQSTATLNASSGSVIQPPAAAQITLTDASGKTVYQWTGTGQATVGGQWSSAGTYVETPGQAGIPIFYFAGDTEPGQQNGLSVQGWSLVMVNP